MIWPWAVIFWVLTIIGVGLAWAGYLADLLPVKWVGIGIVLVDAVGLVVWGLLSG